MGAIPPHREIDAILIGEDHSSDDDNSVERIEGIIEDDGWDVVRACLLAVLEDPARPVAHWKVVAAVFWGALLDSRPVPADRLIALLYVRLPNDEHSGENNLAWSITCRLRGVGYMSGYDPLADPGVQRELSTIRR